MSYGQNPHDVPKTPGQPIAHGTVKNYLVESILSLVCCGGLLAIPALIFALQVNGKLDQGDYEGAVEASNNAKKWCIIAVSIAVVCGGLSFILWIIAIALGAMANA